MNAVKMRKGQPRLFGLRSYRYLWLFICISLRMTANVSRLTRASRWALSLEAGEHSGRAGESDRCPQLTTDHLCMRKMEMGSILFHRRKRSRRAKTARGRRHEPRDGSEISRREGRQTENSEYREEF